MNRENGFAGSVDWNARPLLDAPPDRLELALTLIRPVRGPIELVHLRNDVEVDRWTLTLPDRDTAASTICWIRTPREKAPCGATLSDPPFLPSGYYYLRAQGNVVLEGGLAFYVCD
jgi:hypothetical protein